MSCIDKESRVQRLNAADEGGGGIGVRLESRHCSFKCGTTCSSGVSSTVRIRRDGDRFGSEKRNIRGKGPTRTEEPSKNWNASSRWECWCSVGCGGANIRLVWFGLIHRLRGEIVFFYLFYLFIFSVWDANLNSFSVVCSRSVCSDLFYLIG